MTEPPWDPTHTWRELDPDGNVVRFGTEPIIGYVVAQAEEPTDGSV